MAALVAVPAIFSQPAAAQSVNNDTGSAGFLTIVVMVGLGAILVDSFTNFDVPGAGLVRGIGDTAGGPVDDLTDFLTSAAGVATMLVGLIMVLIGTGAAGLGPRAGLAMFVALELVALYLLLRELESYNLQMFTLVALVTAFIALSATGQPVIGAIANSPVGPIAAVGGIALLWRLFGSNGGGNA